MTKEDGLHMRLEPLSFWSIAIRPVKAQQTWVPMDIIILWISRLWPKLTNPLVLGDRCDASVTSHTHWPPLAPRLFHQALHVLASSV